MSEPTRSSSYRFGTFELQPNERRLLAGGEPVVLGPRAFDLLIALVERPGQLVTKEELLDCVWPKLVVEENNLQVQVSALRKILGQEAIATIPGRGYRFTVTLTASNAPLKTLLPPIDENVPSIAVLPFVNMSDDAANEYFADGIAEELLNVLSKIRGLRVASHTSAFSFKGGKVDIPTVAQKLNVATVLEGSVRKAGKRVRITAQLVEVATDSHLWSRTYDRDLNDIFAVQDDIARSVVQELQAALLGEKPDAPASAAVKAELQAAAKGRGANAKAYALYLQGRFVADRITRDDLAKGIQYFREALELDPGYALAWAELSRAHLNEAGYSWAPLESGFGKARMAAERALELEPDLAEAYVALGLVQMNYDWDWQRADASFRRALSLAPGNAEVPRGAAVLAGTLGRNDEAVALARRAVALDPLSMSAHRRLGARCLGAGLLDEAEAVVKKAIEFSPQGGLLHAWLGRVHLAQGRIEEAREAFEKEVIEYYYL